MLIELSPAVALAFAQTTSVSCKYMNLALIDCYIIFLFPSLQQARVRVHT